MVTRLASHERSVETLMRMHGLIGQRREESTFVDVQMSNCEDGKASVRQRLFDDRLLIFLCITF